MIDDAEPLALGIQRFNVTPSSAKHALMYNFDYEIYDSNKQMLDKADSYILKEGYYYIFVHMDFGGIVTINKLS